MLRLGFHKRLGNFHLEIDAEITQTVTAVLGVSGSGKSTLLNCISGILHPDEGVISFLGEILYSSQEGIRLPPEKRRFGYVFQEGLLFPHLTVQKNIFYGHNSTSRNGEQIDINRVIDILEIGDLLKRHPHQLSGGQRQRVALARALAICPRMLLMDEPLAALDAGLKHRILPYLHHIKEAFDIPILYVTHSISEAMALADEAFLLDEGRVTAQGEPHRLLTSPSALPIAQMTGVENILALPVIVCDQVRGVTELEIGSQKLLVPYTEIEVGKLMQIGIRAEDIIVSLEPDLPISARNVLSGEIRGIDPFGDRIMMSAEIEEHSLSVKITNEARNQLGLVVGMRCYFVIKANAVNPLWET